MKTRFICTIGPKTVDRESLARLHSAGMNIARVNGAHGSLDDVKAMILRLARDLPDGVEILLDLPGNKIRTDNIPEPIPLTAGQEFVLKPENLTYRPLYKSLKPGDIGRGLSLRLHRHHEDRRRDDRAAHGVRPRIHVCSNATIAGQYGFQDSGTRDVNGKTVQYDSVRTAKFSGEGKHQGKGQFSVGGIIRTCTTTGKFAVAGDCTFTMDAVTTYADGAPPTSYKQFGVVVRGGKEILTIQMSGRRPKGAHPWTRMR